MTALAAFVFGVLVGCLLSVAAHADAQDAVGTRHG